MKKLLFAILITTFLAACGTAYNTQLKQVQLGMSKQQIVGLMGDKFITKDNNKLGTKQYETLEYKDKFKNYWLFTFENNELVKWWKEKE